eukprot:304231-Rhodomonas_salina.5
MLGPGIAERARCNVPGARRKSGRTWYKGGRACLGGSLYQYRTSHSGGIGWYNSLNQYTGGEGWLYGLGDSKSALGEGGGYGIRVSTGEMWNWYGLEFGRG